MGEEEYRAETGKSFDLLGQHVTNFRTKSCMVAYEW